jgi:hypothetical protein
LYCEVREILYFNGNIVVEAGGVEPIHAIENTQVADFGTPTIPLMPPIPSTFAQFCSLVPPEGLAAILLRGNSVELSFGILAGEWTSVVVPPPLVSPLAVAGNRLCEPTWSRQPKEGHCASALTVRGNSLPRQFTLPDVRSSTVEHSAVNRRVVGSNPT